ncbi:phage holin [Lactobacillus rhamnosus]|uniref:Phage holin n=1 Tax=Lacticaseibacillus rhamnosus TaxID=47715 RepID=A0A7Y7UKJ1_LACRH|nr:phage holin [Lacticaseibacillus rhamnosus]NVO88961.1 phage holin [Lacticaseibacillus rhamnosus]
MKTKKINWTVRMLSVKFWLALVPAILLVGQSVAAVFGYNWDFASLGKQLTGVINAVFAVLTIVGVTVDPTTQGVSDSQRALSYPGIITTKAAKIKALQDQIKALQTEKDDVDKTTPTVSPSASATPVSSSASISQAPVSNASQQ